MKKILCLIVALIIAISLCSVTAVAFAEEADTETPEETSRAAVVFHPEIFDNLKAIKDIEKIQGTNEKFKLDNSWITAQNVADVFENIDFALDEESEKEFAFASGKDKIYIEYCSYSKEYKENWTRQDLTSTIRIADASKGWWGFRYVVTDSKGSTTIQEEHDLCKTSPIFIYFTDMSDPTFTGLSDNAKKYMENGVKVGTTVSVTSSFVRTSDGSSTSVSFQIFKKVNGEWDMETPVYESLTKKVAEGYEDRISTSGAITMTESDVLGDKVPVYLIIFNVRDEMGFTATTKGTNNEVLLFAVPVEKTRDSALTWQIVLYVVAGLAAVGIIIVLVLPQKEKNYVPAKPAPQKTVEVVAEEEEPKENVAEDKEE